MAHCGLHGPVIRTPSATYPDLVSMLGNTEYLETHEEEGLGLFRHIVQPDLTRFDISMAPGPVTPPWVQEPMVFMRWWGLPVS
jgi:hypothetical protein